jgi:hypothetical protein
MLENCFPHIAFFFNLMCAILAWLCCWYSYKIWRTTRYIGKKWLTFFIGYAAILRTVQLFDPDGFGSLVAYAIVIFWLGLFYSLERLYGESKDIMYHGEHGGKDNDPDKENR